MANGEDPEKAAEVVAHKTRLDARVAELFDAEVVSDDLINQSEWGGTVHKLVIRGSQGTRTVAGKVNENRNGAKHEAANLDLFTRIDGVYSPKLLSPIEWAAQDGVIVMQFLEGENLQRKLNRNSTQRLPRFTFQHLLKQLVAIHSSYKQGGDFAQPGIRDSKFTTDLTADPEKWKRSILRDATLRGSSKEVVDAARSISIPVMVAFLYATEDVKVRTWGDAKPFNVVDKPDFGGSTQTTPHVVDVQESSIGSPFWDLAQLFEILPVQAQAAFFSDYLQMMREEHGLLTEESISDEYAWTAMSQAMLYNIIQGRGFALDFPDKTLMDWKADYFDQLLVRAASVANDPEAFRDLGESAHGYLMGRNGQEFATLPASVGRGAVLL